ncbi:MAG TPA: phospholipase D-like domain-containing protein, partial [Nitrospiraceae bacterium]|nr:phospholipase D-like domain-containing protein [Nitrospiraceae bacterium]
LIEVLRAIGESTVSIDIQQQDIKAAFDEDAAVDQLLRAVAERKAAGVAVRILVSPKYSWDRSLDSVDAYDLGDTIQAIDLNRFTHLHNKGIIFDRQKVLVTSTNWSNNSITKAREAGVLIESTAIAQYFTKTFDQDWEAAIPRGDVASHLIDIRRQIDEQAEGLIQLDAVPTP